MIFDFLVPENYSSTVGVRLLCYTQAEFYKLPEQRQKDFRKVIDELNSHFHKHDVAISFIRNPYIDIIDSDPAYRLSVGACAIPKTKTGKEPKYSHYISFGMPPEVEFGQIGKAWVVFWRDHQCYGMHFRSTKAEKLFLWRVTTRRGNEGRDIVLFQNCENE